MPADPRKYRVFAISERRLQRIPGVGFNGCRIAAQLMATGAASCGEVFILPNGRRMGSAGITGLLKRMQKASGDPDRDGFNQSHNARFAAAIKYPEPRRFNVSPGVIWDALDDSVITAAGNPSHIEGASKLERLAAARGWPGVNHELVLDRRRVEKGQRQVHILDPMAFEKTGKKVYSGDWVPWDEMVQFMRSREIQNGGIPVCERYIRGEWTAASRQTKRLRDEANQLARDKSTLQRRIDHKNETIADLQERQGALEEQVEDLLQQLAERPDTDCAIEIDTAIREREQEIIDFIQA